MRSKWFKYKSKAVQLRESGLSVRSIEKDLGIPRSTLSGWFRDVTLSDAQQKLLEKKRINGLRIAREKAALWHRAAKEKRIATAKEEGSRIIDSLSMRDPVILETALAMLYLGEGTKNGYSVRIANSSPMILGTCVKLLQTVYGINPEEVKCGLNLRSDQDSRKMRRFWSNCLNIPMKNFTYVFVDRRTVTSKTYADYKGVCMIRCGNTSIKRRIQEVGNAFCKRLLKS